jgi:hypothetical protein
LQDVTRLCVCVFCAVVQWHVCLWACVCSRACARSRVLRTTHEGGAARRRTRLRPKSKLALCLKEGTQWATLNHPARNSTATPPPPPDPQRAAHVLDRQGAADERPLHLVPQHDVQPVRHLVTQGRRVMDDG